MNKILAALFFAGLCAAQTSSQNVVLTFEGLQDGEQVLNYYNGGFGSQGSGPGPNYGITFGPDALASISSVAVPGAFGRFSGNPSGYTTVSFQSGPGVIMNVPAGFTTGFSFYYASGSYTGTVTVYDANNNVLQQVALQATGTGCDSTGEFFDCWKQTGVSFSGVATSVDFSGAVNEIGFDNITLGSQTPGQGCGLIITTTALAGGFVGDPYSQTLSASGSGCTPPYHWSATGLPSWASVTDQSSTSGVLDGIPAAVGTFPLILTVTDSSLPVPASYTTPVPLPLVIVTPSTGDGGSQGGTLGVTPSSLTFAAGPGVLPPPQNINITSSSGTLDWSATPSLTNSAPANWISVSPTGGSASPGSPGSTTVTVAAVASTFPTGTYTANVTVSSGTQVMTVAVALTVTQNQLLLTQSVMVFAALVNAPGPPGQTLSVSTTGGALSFAAQATYQTPPPSPWLSVPPSASAPTNLTVSVQPINLPAGTYTGYINLSAAGTTPPPAVTVYLVVKAAPDNTVSFSYTIGGALPVPQVLLIYPPSVTPVSVLAGAGSDQNWLAVNPPTGTASPAAPVQFTLTASPGSLPAAQYQGILAVTDLNGDAYVALATLTIGLPAGTTTNTITFAPLSNVTIGVAPLGLSATASSGLPVSFASTTPSVCTVSQSTATILAVGTCTITASQPGNSTFAPATPVTRSFTVNPIIVTPTALQLLTVAPCRIMDTRLPTAGGTFPANSTFGSPYLAAGAIRTIPLPTSACNVPADAMAYSLNFTVVPRTVPMGSLTAWPTGTAQPLAQTLTSPDGSILAAAALVPAGTGGSINVSATDDTDLVVDINGYFVPPTTGTLQFYPLSPCRVLDTRNANGTFGGPALAGGATGRSFPIPSSADVTSGEPCGVPSDAAAYSLNITVVPSGALAFLTSWPTGQNQPFVSTMNSLDGTVLANAAIVPAGTDGAVSFYAFNTTNLVVDINGYFAPPGSSGGLNFYAVPPCRLVDTRNAAGLFGGPAMSAGMTRNFPLSEGSCGLPAYPALQAYSLSISAFPPAYLGYLTAWPTGEAQPYVSTLNAWKGLAVTNAALLPAGLSNGGSISIYVTAMTDVVIDTAGYFGP